MADRDERRHRRGPASGSAADSGFATPAAETSFPRDIRTAIAYLRLNPHRAVPMAELAAQAGVSPRRLQEHFRSFVGMPPSGYGLRLRLNAVRQELQRPFNSQPVTRIALHYGFSHLGRFSRQYQRLFGELPSATRSGAAPEAGGRSRLAAPTPRGDRPVIAILPFHAPAALFGLARLLANAIAAALSGDAAIRVEWPHAPLGRRDLAARYVMRGQLLAAGERFRVGLALVDAADHGHVWGDSWDGLTATPFATVDRVVAAVAGAVLPNIHKAEIARAKAMRP